MTFEPVRHARLPVVVGVELSRETLVEVAAIGAELFHHSGPDTQSPVMQLVGRACAAVLQSMTWFSDQPLSKPLQKECRHSAQ